MIFSYSEKCDQCDMPHTVMFLSMQCLKTSITFLWSCNHLRALKESWEGCSCLSTGISCCFRHMMTAQSWHTGHELHNELTLSRRNNWRSSTSLKTGNLNPALLRSSRTQVSMQFIEDSVFSGCKCHCFTPAQRILMYLGHIHVATKHFAEITAEHFWLPGLFRTV